MTCQPFLCNDRTDRSFGPSEMFEFKVMRFGFVLVVSFGGSSMERDQSDIINAATAPFSH
jgi:hypothetical protein